MFLIIVLAIFTSIIISLIFDTRNWFLNLSDLLLSRNNFDGYIYESGFAYIVSGIIIIAIVVNILIIFKLIFKN